MFSTISLKEGEAREREGERERGRERENSNSKTLFYKGREREMKSVDKMDQ